jgi:hypothetical protein
VQSSARLVHGYGERSCVCARSCGSAAAQHEARRRAAEALADKIIIQVFGSPQRGGATVSNRENCAQSNE